jgi:hypothetical protein
MFVELRLVITGQKLHESGNECILCGLFDVMCPEVFELTDKLVVKPSAGFNQHEAEKNNLSEDLYLQSH